MTARRHTHSQRLAPALAARRRFLLPLAFAATVMGCQAAPAGKAAIDGPDPAHTEKLPLPPAELGLPPDPMGDHKKAKVETFAVPPPPISDDYWPCSQCHDDPADVNRTRRELKDEHENIVLQHDAEHRWCLDCHDADNRDVLHLASGATVTFDESYKLCGQCHGTQYRDWKIGVHGKRTGMWDGEKQYLLCAHCHNPHSPHFKPLKPMPPPIRPEQVR